jgi:hypothetical protein
LPRINEIPALIEALERHTLGGRLEIHAVFYDADIKLTARRKRRRKRRWPSGHLLNCVIKPANCELRRRREASKEPLVLRGFRASRLPGPHD